MNRRQVKGRLSHRQVITKCVNRNPEAGLHKENFMNRNVHAATREARMVAWIHYKSGFPEKSCRVHIPAMERTSH